MADGGDVHIVNADHSSHVHKESRTVPSIDTGDTTEVEKPITSPRIDAPVHRFRARRRRGTDLDDYFAGPRDVDKHSKWPLFMRLHGSILPEMILPIIWMGCWASLITCLSKFVQDLGVSSILLTILGFVVAMALSFGTSTAYERYSQGRQYWSQLSLTSHELGRIIWILVQERPGELGKQDLLAKLTGLNLVTAFAVALKHKLRFEPHINYADLQGLVNHLDTFAKEATTPEVTQPRQPSIWKSIGQYLGLSFAESNPRKLLKKSTRPTGNLPLEILNYLTAYINQCVSNGTLLAGVNQAQALGAIKALDDILTGTERILNTPMPIAYSISMSQITWVYVMLLPFQLYGELGWITIPATMFGSYIVLALWLIGREIENPFGNDVNDLPLDTYCDSIAEEIDVIISRPAPKPEDFIKKSDNLVLYPLSQSGYPVWESRSIRQIREALMAKAHMTLESRKSTNVSRPESMAMV